MAFDFYCFAPGFCSKQYNTKKIPIAGSALRRMRLQVADDLLCYFK